MYVTLFLAILGLLPQNLAFRQKVRVANSGIEKVLANASTSGVLLDGESKSEQLDKVGDATIKQAGLPLSGVQTRKAPSQERVSSLIQDGGMKERSNVVRGKAAEPEIIHDMPDAHQATETHQAAQIVHDTFGLVAAHYEGVFKLGVYDIIQETSVVEGIERTTNEVIQLQPGDAVNVLKVVYVESDTRVRALIEHPRGPKGWITLLDTSDEYHWAKSRGDFCLSVSLCSWNYDKCFTDKEGTCMPKALEAVEAVATEPLLADKFGLGLYDVIQDLDVTSTMLLDELDESSDVVVGHLKIGDVVTVVKVEYVESITRFRAEIEEPRGWITLLDTSDDFKGADDRTVFCKSVSKVWCSYYWNRCTPNPEGGCLPRPLRDPEKYSAKGFHVGPYDVIAFTHVTSTNSFESEVVGTLKDGAIVNVLKVEYVEKDTRVRAEIEHPRGWISITDKSDGFVWATDRTAMCAAAYSCSPLHDKCFMPDDGEICLPIEAPPAVAETPPAVAVVEAPPAVADPSDRFPLGIYDIERFAEARKTVDMKSDKVGELNKGDAVYVVEVVYVPETTRVRAKVESTDGWKGWISLLDASDNTLWVKNRDDFCASVSFCSWYYIKCQSTDSGCKAKALEMKFPTGTKIPKPKPDHAKPGTDIRVIVDDSIDATTVSSISQNKPPQLTTEENDGAPELGAHEQGDDSDEGHPPKTDKDDENAAERSSSLSAMAILGCLVCYLNA